VTVPPLLGGRVALITGGASGQGRAASVLFAQHGARILFENMIELVCANKPIGFCDW